MAGVLALLAGALPLIAYGASSQRPGKRPAVRGMSGKFSLIMMVHTSDGGYGTLPGVNPWNGSLHPGAHYVYRSIPCSGDAPLNNISSDLPSFEGRVPGSRSPSSLRAHPFAFRLHKTKTQGWRMIGAIKLTVCQLKGGPTFKFDPITDELKPKITVNFDAAPRRITPEILHFDGTFKLSGGTQRYHALTGAGKISGYLFCFAVKGCQATGGRYLDGQFVMQGDYADPTPQL